MSAISDTKGERIIPGELSELDKYTRRENLDRNPDFELEVAIQNNTQHLMHDGYILKKGL